MTESVSFAHVAIDHSHSQRPVPRGFPLFKRCEWLINNCNVAKRVVTRSNGTFPKYAECKSTQNITNGLETVFSQFLYLKLS